MHSQRTQHHAHPGIPASRHPGIPASRHPGNPATRQPGNPATRQPGNPAAAFMLTNARSTRRPGNAAAPCASRQRRAALCTPTHAHTAAPCASSAALTTAGAHGVATCDSTAAPYDVARTRPAAVCDCAHTRRPDLTQFSAAPPGRRVPPRPAAAWRRPIASFTHTRCPGSPRLSAPPEN
jgi:hypothetical protein